MKVQGGQLVTTSSLATYAAHAAVVYGGATASQQEVAALVATAALLQAYTLLNAVSHARTMLALLFLVPLWGFISQTGLVPDARVPPFVSFVGSAKSGGHPIEILVREAETKFTQMVERQSKTLTNADNEYRSRYGRSPPPGFDIWFDLAIKADLAIIDDYDAITKPFEPFFGLSAREIRTRVNMTFDSQDYVMKFSIKDHELSSEGQETAMASIYNSQLPKWMQAYLQHLPDLDFVVSTTDEPRVLLPNDELEHLLRHCPSSLSGSGLHSSSEAPLSSQRQELEFLHARRQRTFDLATLPCPPDSPSRSGPALYNPPDQPHLSFITNITSSRDVCLNPSFGFQHGMFASINDISLTLTLLPIFNQAAPSSFQDLLIPSPWYTMRYDEEYYVESDDPDWKDKQDTLYWVGGSTDGVVRSKHWDTLQRHRFALLVNNASQPAIFLRKGADKNTWEEYPSTMSGAGLYPDMIHVHLAYQADADCEGDACDDERERMVLGEKEEASAAYQSRFLFDLDGHAHSERFLRYLGSKSLVFKQTVEREWHDDWLVPWWHYVPVSMGMQELPEMLNYFARDPKGRLIAEEIAERGREWARKSLRKVDFELGMFRIMLEWARLVSDERDREGAECGLGRIRQEASKVG
ncbi:hypothetical protein P7C71_g1737, partial [Lecanoromycetidae sp. Uapishka_2]